MIVVIANKLKNIIDSCKVIQGDFKCATGNFSSTDCINTISSMTIDYLVLDITALKDAFEIGCWKKFKEVCDPTKTVILLEHSKSYSSAGFLSMLVTMGFYNFARTSEDIERLINHPNIYQDVAKYQKMAISMEEKREEGEEKVGEYYRKMEETQDMMQDYMKRYQEGEFKEPKKINAFGFQVKVGLIFLPLLTFLGAMIVYLLNLWIGNIVPATGDYVGEYIYKDLTGTGITPLTLIGVLISLLIFALYYSYLNTAIKRKQMTRGKFIVIPFAIYAAIIFGEYHVVGLLGNLYNAVMFVPLTDKPYLCQDLYLVTQIIAMTAIVLFYVEILVNNSKTLRFEKDLSQNLTFVEKIWATVLTLLIAIPVFSLLANIFPSDSPVYQAMVYLYDFPMLMIGLAFFEIILAIFIVLTTLTKKDKKYEELKEEDLYKFVNLTDEKIKERSIRRD